MPNKLASSTSPYLLQHANNPVDWHPWGPEALEKARREDKPILLSIGYAACHWCHVMERESFEDHDTATLMNEHFISIKVDREERPDLDAIYMDAVQAMTGHGGWPMTMFCSPEGAPLYGGTYFPPEDRHGLPAFRKVLTAVAEAWRERREELLAQGSKMVSYISAGPAQPPVPAETTGAQPLRDAFDRMAAAFDGTWGGFGRAPKFPQPMNLEFLLRATRLGFEGAGRMLTLSLWKMARGGIFDHIGGGFHRYAVDGEWLVPHFEKMLYDNSQLLRLYARAALATRLGSIDGDELLYRATALATGEFLLREMRHPEGGFFSSLDADSEGVEGKFYVWSFDELTRAAGGDASVAASFWAASPGGNWEGTNVLWAPRSDDDVAAEQGVSPAEVRTAVERARARLFEVRAARVRPATDDKILTSWNGLAISGLAEAGRAFGRRNFIDAAAAAASFVLSKLRTADGRLLRSWREGRTSGPAFLDDHSILAAALLDLYETTFDERWFAEAIRIVGRMIDLFADPKGGFYDTGSDAEALVVRPKDVFDNAIPSGNSVAADVLLRLAALTGDHSYEERAEGTLAPTRHAMSAAPLGFGHALGALDWLVNRPKEVAVANGDGADALAHTVWERPMLNRVLAVGDPGVSSVPLLRDRTRRDGKATAYVCENFTCTLPVTDRESLAELLDE